jgi:hypothetical protein
MLEKIRAHKILLSILLAALVLRLIGFWHGFPFIFHPDEPSVIRSALGLRFNPNPGHFDWPHLHFYLNYLVYIVFIKFRAFLALTPFFDVLKDTVLWRDPIVFYMLSRILNGFLGAFTIIPLYLAGKEIGGKKAGLLAAVFFAFIPLHVRVSHFALIDVPAVFWMTWGIYFSYKVLTSPSCKNYAVAGLLFGLAASTKYNGLFGAVALIISHLIVSYKAFNFNNFIFKPLLALLMCFGAFWIGTPFSVFDFSTFSQTDTPRGAFWQFTNVGSVSFIKQIRQFFTEALSSVAVGVGFTYVLLLMGFVVDFGRGLASRKNIQTFLLTAFPAFLIIFNVAGFSRQQSHYYLMAYPFVVLAVSVYLSSLDLKQYFKLVIIFLLSVPVLLSLHQIIKLSVTDTRVQTYQHIQKHIQPKSTILYNSEDFRPLAEKLKKDYKLKKVSKYSQAKDFSGAYWLVKSPTKEAINNDIVVTSFSNIFRNGPEVYIYFIQ